MLSRDINDLMEKRHPKYLPEISSHHRFREKSSGKHTRFNFFVTTAVAGMDLLNEQTIGVISGNFSEVGFPNLVVFGLDHVNPALFNVYISLPLKIEY